MVRKLLSSTLFRLLLAVVVGLVVGPFVGSGFMSVVVVVKYILGQLIFFMVPLIVLSFISSSIVKMGALASRLLSLSLLVAYLSSIGAAFLALLLGYNILPCITVASSVEASRVLPELLFEFNIPPVMSVISALVLAVMVGLSALWSGAESVTKLLGELQRMVMLLIERVMIPILPIFIAANFSALSYQGAITHQLPIFLNVMLVVLVAHFVWLVVLYSVAGLISLKNPWQVVRYYAQPYFTAVGTMSSAATLPISLAAAKRSPILRGQTVDFAIPIFSNIHLCGSILTEVFFVMTVSKILYGTFPDLSTMIIFVLLLGVFAIGAPGVPGGTVIASLGIVTSVVGFDAAGTALLLTIFALQDSFGTACNVVGDGALTLIVDSYNRAEG
ncbi:MAG: cation:dicarboxylase symporter family transporter [Rikenellaceae bacterium]